MTIMIQLSNQITNAKTWNIHTNNKKYSECPKTERLKSGKCRNQDN